MPPSTIIVTVPGMISEADYAPLEQVSSVRYVETDHVTENQLADLCAGHDYLMLNYDVVKRLSPAFYAHEGVKALRSISMDLTGVDWASADAAAAQGVPLQNIPHYSTESVAETALAEVLLHSRQRHSAYTDQLHGRPVQARSGFNLAGQTAGVVGLGNIGTRVAELLAAVGMDVVAWNRTERPSEFRAVSLPELFATSRVICICVAFVPEGDGANIGMLGRALLEHANDAVVVNLARPELVDPDAMADAIEAQKVLGYTVERYDVLAASRLGQLDQVHIPPKNAWASEESLATLRRVWVRNVLDAIDGTFTNAVGAAG